MNTPLHDALLARDIAFAALDAADWKQETKDIVTAILRVASECSSFSSNDVRPLLPEDVNTNRVGRAFKLAQDRGWIAAVNLEPSSAVSTRGHHVFRYRLVTVAAEVAS